MSALVVYYYAVDPHSDLPLERSPIKLIEIAIGPNRAPMPKVSAVASARRNLEAVSPPPWRDNVPEQRTKYAAALLDQKIETETPAGMCARMELVRDVATEAGDCATALKAIENIYATFTVSAHALNSMNADVLKKALSATLNSTALVETQKMSVRLGFACIAQDDYEPALSLATTAQELAKLAKKNCPRERSEFPFRRNRAL